MIIQVVMTTCAKGHCVVKPSWRAAKMKSYPLLGCSVMMMVWIVWMIMFSLKSFCFIIFWSFKTWDIFFFGLPLLSRATDVFLTGDDHQESEEVFHFRGTNRDCSRVKPVIGDSFCDDEARLLKVNFAMLCLQNQLPDMSVFGVSLNTATPNHRPIVIILIGKSPRTWGYSSYGQVLLGGMFNERFWYPVCGLSITLGLLVGCWFLQELFTCGKPFLVSTGCSDICMLVV